MTTFKQFNKCFCGMLILICCLFGEVEMVKGKTVDLNMECIDMSMSIGEEITPDDVCIAAGFGHCREVLGLEILQIDVCSGVAGVVNSAIVTNCSDSVTATSNGKSVLIGAAPGGIFKCNATKTWGIIPQPENVPDDFNQSIKNATDWILGFVGMIAVLMLIWGGINYLTSAGDEDKARTGKKTVTYALIGLVVAGIAYAIVDVIIMVIL